MAETLTISYFMGRGWTGFCENKFYNVSHRRKPPIIKNKDDEKPTENSIVWTNKEILPPGGKFKSHGLMNDIGCFFAFSCG